MLRIAIAALAIAAADGCFLNHGACYNAGFVDGLATPELCQAACQLRTDCNYWSWHPDRNDKRCHMCKTERRGSCGDARGNNCVWGPEWCPGDDDDEDSPAKVLEKTMDFAERFCGSDGKGDALDAALALHAVGKEWHDGVHRGDEDLEVALKPAADKAAKVLATGCNAADTCNRGAVLVSNLRAFLLVHDGDAERALADDRARKAIFDDYSVYLADGGFFDEDSVAAIDDWFDSVPTRLAEGFTYGAPYLTMTARDAFNCGSQRNNPGGAVLVFTARGFNVFATQYGDRTEDAFRGTTESSRGDLLLTVLRHEGAHQFDRTMSSRLQKLLHTIKNECSRVEDWLRAGVAAGGVGANNFFKKAPQEIIASQFGNQYMLSSSKQFKVARTQASKGHRMPMSWFLFNVELAADGDESFFYERKDLGDIVRMTVLLERAEDGEIEKMTVPGCGTWSFDYRSDGLVRDYDGPDCACVPLSSGGGGAPSPHPRPTKAPTEQPTKAPTEQPTLLPAPPRPTREPAPRPSLAAPTDVPTSTAPTASPVAACVGDDPSWTKRGGPETKNCAWVGLWAPRCDVRGNNNLLARNSCPCACAAAAPPVVTAAPTASPQAGPLCVGDDPDWTKRGSPSFKNCSWVSDWAPRCDVRGEDAVLAWDACPCACPAPPVAAARSISPDVCKSFSAATSTRPISDISDVYTSGATRAAGALLAVVAVIFLAVNL